MLSFGFTGELQSGPSGTVGDFCFGLLSDSEISVSNFCPAGPNELLVDTLQNAISGITLPHDLDDLRFLPAGNVCQIAGKGGLKFTASVQYSILNNALATAPFELFSNALTLKLQSGPKFQVAVEHSSTHQLTIAALGDNKIRLAASLTKEVSTEEALDFSIGVSANIGSTDALPFLIQQISSTPDKDLQQIRSLLSTGEQSDLSSQIKTVVQAATKGGLNASLHEALKQSRERNHLFVYEIDLSALDSTSANAVEAALLGNFTMLTALNENLAGIKEISSFSTLTLTHTHTLNIHLLGILNFRDVSSFVKKSKIAVSGETSEVVLAATDIKVLQNTIDADHLRAVLTKSAMITTAAATTAQTSDFKFKMVYFLKKAGPHSSDLQQMYNTLAFTQSPDAAQAKAMLNPSAAKPPDALLYLTLELNQALSRNIFKGKTIDDFVKAGQLAARTILANDPQNQNRLRLLNIDLAFWNQLRGEGSADNIRRTLNNQGMTDEASPVDFMAIDWWAQAMGGMAAAVAKGQKLMDAEKKVLQTSQGGFNLPWALLATAIAAGDPKLVAGRFEAAGTQPSVAAAKAG